MTSTPKAETLLDVVCLGCGRMCDDLRVTRAPGRPPTIEPDCRLGAEWVRQACDWRPGPPLIEGRLVEPNIAFDRAASILHGSARPLVCGLRGVDVKAARHAVAIADLIGGCVDWTTSATDLAAAESFQTVGAVEGSLGEVIHYADLVICWRCDPATTHPRLFDQLTKSDGARPAPVLIAVGETGVTSRSASVQIEFLGSQSVQVLLSLRSAFAGLTGDPLADPRHADPPNASVERLAELIRDSQTSAVLYDSTLLGEGHSALTQLTLFAQHIQEQTRLLTAPLGRGDNSCGVQSVLTWQTGFPLGVSFAAGAPEYGPGDYTTNELLERGEVDAVLVTAEEGLEGLSETAKQNLRSLPSVVLTSASKSDLAPTVTLSAAPLAARAGGAVMRNDGVMLPTKHSLAATGPTHSEVLADILGRLTAAAGRKKSRAIGGR